jgi:hypothetical protein
MPRFDLPWGGYLEMPEFEAPQAGGIKQCYPVGKFLKKLLNPFESIDEACNSCGCDYGEAGGDFVEVISLQEILSSCRGKRVFIYEKIEDGNSVRYERHGPFSTLNLPDLVVLASFDGKAGFFNCF